MKKNNILILICSVILSIFSIFNILFLNNSKEKIKLNISIEKKDETKDVIVDEFLINNNDYITKKIFKIKNEKIYYKENFEYSLTKNDEFNIKFNKTNISNISIKLNNKDLKIINEKNSFIVNHEVNKLNILKNQFNKINLFYLITFGVIFIILYYFMFKQILINLKRIFEEKIKIIDIISTLILLFIIYYLNFYSVISIIDIGLIFVVFLILGLIMFYNKKHLNLTNAFLIITMFLGITIMFLIPPFHILDEDNHYIKTYDHLFFLEKSNSVKNKTKISKNVYDFRGKYQNNKFKYAKINPLSYYNDMNIKVNYKDLSEKSVRFGTYSTMKLAYIPSNFITFICKRLNINLLLTFMLARFINLILATIICFLAIKIIPICKPLLFIIMTFGICTQSIMGINQDWLNTSVCFLSISYILYLIYKKEKIERKEYITLFLLATLLAFSKTIYTPIFLLVLLINNKKFDKSIKHPLINKFLIIGIAFGLTLLSYFWNIIFNPEILITGGSSVEHHSLINLLKNPVKLVSIYFNTFKMRNVEDIIRGYFNGYGWYTIWHNNIVKICILLSYIFIIFTLPKEKIKEEKKSKLLSMFIFISMYGLITLSMLLTWSNIEFNYIDGLQPRYFLPIIFFLYFVFNNNIFKFKNNSNYQILLIGSILILNFLSYFTIVYRLF